MAPGIAPSGKRLLVIGVAVSGLAAAAYLGALLTHPSSALLDGYDLRVYLGGGSVVRHSPGNLYVWHYRNTPGIQFLYTPFAAMIFAALSFVPWRVLSDVMTVADVAAVVVTVWIAFRELGWPDLKRRLGATLLVSGVVFWLEPVQRVLFLGQVELLLMVLVVWDMCQPGKRPWQGAGVGLAAAIKLVPLIFIAYLVITRRLRAASVALAVFAVTIVAGFAALPHASAQWWLRGTFLRAGAAVFIGFGGNQSLRGTLTRFAGSAAHGEPLWLAVAAVAGVTGLVAAAVLHRNGFEFEGLMACALTGLLLSPISWDHHWVWIAPGLAVLVAAGMRAASWPVRLAWFSSALVLVLVFAGWPSFLNAGQGHGLIWYAPATPFASGDSPGYLEYHWHGIQLLDGNFYVLTGCALLLAAVVAAIRMAGPSSRAPGAWLGREFRQAHARTPETERGGT
jgi:alpha-1,2-mannosyltransferase